MPRSKFDHGHAFQGPSYGPVHHDRLLFEGDPGRLEFIGTQFDRGKLEWVRDYLRFTLAGVG